MKKAYLIKYDPKKTPGRKHDPLYKEIKKSLIWWHYLESTWLIVTNETAEQIWDRLKSHVNKNDYILIIEVRSDYHGWLPEKAWDWIEENIPD